MHVNMKDRVEQTYNFYFFYPYYLLSGIYTNLADGESGFLHMIKWQNRVKCPESDYVKS